MRITELGMGKEEFYKKSGISSASFSQWNTGMHAPTKKKIAQAALALNVSVEYLLAGNEKKPDPETGNELTEMQQKAMRLIMEMSDSQLRVFIAALEAGKES